MIGAIFDGFEHLEFSWLAKQIFEFWALGCQNISVDKILLVAKFNGEVTEFSGIEQFFLVLEVAIKCLFLRLDDLWKWWSAFLVDFSHQFFEAAGCIKTCINF